MKYKNLDALLKGKRWLLRPHALRSVTSSSSSKTTTAADPIANIFLADAGVVVAIGFGGAADTVHVTLSSEVVGQCTATVHHAGGGAASVAGVVASDGESVVYTVQLGEDGESMLQIPCPLYGS